MPASRTDPAPVEERIEDVDVSTEMQGSFLEYAYSERETVKNGRPSESASGVARWKVSGSPSVSQPRSWLRTSSVPGTRAR